MHDFLQFLVKGRLQKKLTFVKVRGEGDSRRHIFQSSTKKIKNTGKIAFFVAFHQSSQGEGGQIYSDECHFF